ncbi:MAG: hypothetical protein M1828_000481 [Chrysothrix sp. TS-e1954]|nr:MAG: hypothetical protein M1828_000481 [Chrysothrix sp. TS-e1954]
MNTLLQSILAIFLAWLLTKLRKGLLGSPLSKIPGPWISAVTNLRLKLAVLTGTRMYYIHNLHARYGPVVRIAPDEVDVADVEAFGTIHNLRTGYPKSDWYERIGGNPVLGSFQMRDKKQHGARRRLLARGFSVSHLRADWEGEVFRLVRYAVSRLQQEMKATEGGQGDLYKWATLAATDIAGRVMFGDTFKMIEKGEKTEYIQLLDTAMMLGGIDAEIPGFLPFCAMLPFKSTREIGSMRTRLINGASTAIERAKAPSNTSEANIFAKIISETDKDDAVLTDEHIIIEARNLIIAGSDTTATSFTYVAWAVIQRPELQKQLEEEVGALAEDQIKDEALEKLPLLNAVILETLRLYGAAPSSLPRVVPHGGANLAGHAIPGGTIVDTQAYTMHRLKAVWGKDVELFKPERWLADGGSLQKQVGDAFSPFGAGSRTCLGIHLAWMELRLAVATLFRECRGMKLAEEMTQEEMVFEDFFLMKPRGKRCLVTMKSGG